MSHSMNSPKAHKKQNIFLFGKLLFEFNLTKFYPDRTTQLDQWTQSCHFQGFYPDWSHLFYHYKICQDKAHISATKNKLKAPNWPLLYKERVRKNIGYSSTNNTDPGRRADLLWGYFRASQKVLCPLNVSLIAVCASAEFCRLQMSLFLYIICKMNASFLHWNIIESLNGLDPLAQCKSREEVTQGKLQVSSYVPCLLLFILQ